MLVCGNLLAQQNVGIGTQTPHASAALDVSSTTRGLLAPRMTTAQRSAIASPAKGLLVYDTDINSLFHYNGSAWINLAAGGGGNGWSLTGNAGTDAATNFLGTTDKKSLLFRVNNRFHGGMDTLGNILLGDSAGGALNFNSARNIAIGTGALLRNTRAVQLIAIGDSSMAYSQTGPGLFGGSFGFYNTGVGINTLKSNAGNFNTASGAYAMEDNIGGEYNTAMGALALGNNTLGGGNTAVGYTALTNNTEGTANTAIGFIANGNNTTGQSNTSLGAYTLIGNTTGSNNVALGAEAMQTNTTGYSNVALGFAALRSSSRKSNLVAIGDSALYNNGLGSTEAEEAAKNTAIGSKAMYMNTTGFDNTALGFQALYSNTIGDNNIAIGRDAMRLNSTGNFNTALGNVALGKNTAGYSNTSLGYGTLSNNTTGYRNLAVGGGALLANTTGYSNTALGINALQANTTGQSNLAIGVRALRNNTTHSFNIAIGDSALFSNGIGAIGKDGSENIGIGYRAGYAMTTGYNNTFVGSRAATSTGDGIYNTALGYLALSTNTTGDRNTALGANADVSSGTLSNTTAIGYSATVNASNKIRLGNSSVTVIEGQVAYTTSDGRFKQNIQDNAPGLEFITALKPLTYQYKSYEMERFMNQRNPERQAALNHSDFTEAESMVHMGFIAQDVEKLVKEKGYNLSLVHAPTNPTDNYSIAYGELVVPLVKAVQEQQAMIVEMKLMIEQLKKELAQKK
jgi:hypothetical protein